MDLENKKDIIIHELETMSKKEAIDKNFFKVRAYRKVIDQLKNIESIKSMQDISGVEGIGVKIRAKLEEIFKTGKLKAAERARSSKNIEIYDELLKIHGIGIVKAEELVKNGIKSIVELQNALNENSKILNEKQKIGLKYYLDNQLRIPRSEIYLHSKKLSELKKLDKDLQIKIVGSYRRGQEDSGDIDVLVNINRDIDANKRVKMFKKIITELKDKNYLLADLATGNKKYMGICKINEKLPARRIDILMTSREEYPFALLYFTGDFQINIALRKRAGELGYVLNEYGMKGKDKLELNTEREIFNFLGYQYLKPKDRNINNLKELEELNISVSPIVISPFVITPKIKQKRKSPKRQKRKSPKMKTKSPRRKIKS